jgi:hypothetical protein
LLAEISSGARAHGGRNLGEQPVMIGIAHLEDVAETFRSRHVDA